MHFSFVSTTAHWKSLLKNCVTSCTHALLILKTPTFSVALFYKAEHILCFRCTSKCVRLGLLLEFCSYGSGLFSLILQRDFSFLLLWNWKINTLSCFFCCLLVWGFKKNEPTQCLVN